jgi:beta-lactamase regulating signal transducer with metallopeptidase domain
MLVALAYAMLLIFRVRNSVTRYGIWLSVLIGFIALLLLGITKPLPNLLPLHGSSLQLGKDRFNKMDYDFSAYFGVNDKSSNTLAKTQSKPKPSENLAGNKADVKHRFTFSLYIILVMIWLLGVIWKLGKFVIGCYFMIRLRKRCTDIHDAHANELFKEITKDMGIKRLVSLESSTEIQIPVSMGLLKPAVIMPNSIMNELSDEEMRMIFIHELAHIKRLDFIVKIIQSLLDVLFFFHPIFYLLKTRLIKEMEFLCDDWVIHITGKRCEYARCLLNICADNSSLSFSNAILGHGKNLKRRLEMLLDERRKLMISMPINSIVLLISFTCVFILFTAMIQPVSSDDKVSKPIAVGSNLELIGSASYGLPVLISKSGDYIYVCAGGNLVIFNVSNPPKLVEIGRTNIPAMLIGIDVKGNYAYLVDKKKGLRVVDVSDPTNPKEVGFYDLPGITFRVNVAGDYAFVANASKGLCVIDISDPTKPKKVSENNAYVNALGVSVVGKYAYIANRHDGLRVLDVSNPSNPREVGSYDLQSMTQEVYIYGQYAYVTCSSLEDQGKEENSLNIVDISDPTKPKQTGKCSIVGYVGGFQVSGKYAYIANYFGGLNIVDISDPTNPKEAISFSRSNIQSVLVDGIYAYLGDESGHIKIVDVSNPNKPQEIGDYVTPSISNDVYINGRYAYVAANVLRVIDISDPSKPKNEKDYGTAGSIQTVQAIGNYAYLADGDLRIMDISDPSNVREIGVCITPESSSGVFVVGNYAYVAGTSNEYSGIRIVDISNPSSPQEVSFCKTPGRVFRVFVSNGYAYVANQKNGLRIINVSDPKNPYEVGVCDTLGTAWDIYVVDNYAYVANGEKGVCVVDVSDPAKPNIVGKFDTNKDSMAAISIRVADRHAYVANDYGNVVVLDVSDQANLKQIGSIITPGQPHGLYVDGDIIYVADSWAGFSILKYTGR